MHLLKKENWWVWLILLLFSSGGSYIVLGAMFNVLDKEAWYAKWHIWVIGILLILPFIIMIYVFYIQITVKVAAMLDIKGKEFYLSPYVWILLIIIPFIGWLTLIGLYLYLNIDILIKLYKGEAEKYIN